MGRSDRVSNFMTQIQPDPLIKKIFVIQPNPPSPKNQGLILAGWWVGCTPLARRFHPQKFRSKPTRGDVCLTFFFLIIRVMLYIF